MALIKCSECNKDISDKAPSCPNCGNPLSSPSVHIIQDQPILIEQTSKKWKLVKLISVLLMILGILIALSQVGQDSEKWIVNLGLNILVYGFIGLIIGKLGAWWSHR